MYLPIILTVLLAEATFAAGIFCPKPEIVSVLKNQRIRKVLETFQKDMRFVLTLNEYETKKTVRDYAAVLDEIKAFNIQSAEVNIKLNQVIESVLAGRDHSEVVRLIEKTKKELSDKEQSTDISIARSYLSYFEADALFKMGNHFEASNKIFTAITERQRAQGISLIELEKLEGLIELGRVLNFGSEFNKLFQLVRTHYADLELSFEEKKALTKPFNEIILKKQGKSSAEDPEVYVISRQHAENMVDNVLCDFSQRVSVFGPNFDSLNYNAVLLEASRINETFAHELQKRVVTKLQTEGDAKGAWIEAERIISEIWDEQHVLSDKDMDLMSLVSKKRHNKIATGRDLLSAMETYAELLKAEAMLQETDVVTDIDVKRAELSLIRIKQIRSKSTGVSLGEIIKLEARIVLRSMMEFHKKLAFLYGFKAGQEVNADDKQQIEQLGGCKRILPFFK